MTALMDMPQQAPAATPPAPMAPPAPPAPPAKPVVPGLLGLFLFLTSLSAIGMLLKGLFALVFFSDVSSKAYGALTVALALVIAWCVRGLRKMKRKAYKVGLIVMGVSTAVGAVSAILGSGKGSMASDAALVGLNLVVMFILYMYRDRYVD